jgi:hypothetical protein
MMFSESDAGEKARQRGERRGFGKRLPEHTEKQIVHSEHGNADFEHLNTRLW